MNTRIYAQSADLKGFSIKNCPSMPEPRAVLMCPPDYFQISEGRNPFMAGSVGKVDREKAKVQWSGLRSTFESLGLKVEIIPAAPGLEDMVFTANQTLTGLNTRMEKVCLLSNMRHAARRGEVAHFEKWFAAAGYQIAKIKDPTTTFEGTGDCIWHPGKRLLWGGYGFRTDPEAYPQVAEIFEAPVVQLKLVNERFYHLDTCFCPLNQETVLIYPSAFDPDSLELILKLFPIVLAADEREAASKLPCNAVVADGTAVLQSGSAAAVRHLQAVGLKVREVDTSEFLKSGGSAFCLKMHLY